MKMNLKWKFIQNENSLKMKIHFKLHKIKFFLKLNFF